MRWIILGILFFAIGPNPAGAQQLPAGLTQSWKKLSAEFQSRGTALMALVAKARPGDTASLAQVRASLINLASYADTLKDYDSVSVNRLHDLNLAVLRSTQTVFKELEDHPEKKEEPVIRRLINDLMAIENRCHTARIQYNQACEKLNRPDLRLTQQHLLPNQLRRSPSLL